MKSSISDPSTPFRLERIRRISRFLKIAVILYFLVPLAFIAWAEHYASVSTASVSVLGHSYASTSAIPAAMRVVGGIGSVIYLLGAVSLYRLFGLYEKGIIFSHANIVELRRVGTVLIAYGLLNLIADVVYNGSLVLHMLVIKGVASPWVIVGGAIYIVAWIMDEGRKLQDEQALTV